MSPDLHALTGAYATHSLPDWEEREFQEHLSSCGACAAEVRELEATTARIGSSLATAPPASMKARVLAQIDQTPQLPALERAPSKPVPTAPVETPPEADGVGLAAPPEPDADDTVAGLIQGFADEPVPAPAHAARRQRRRWVQVLAAAASVILLVAVAVLGAANVSLRNQVDELEAQRRTVWQILTAPDATVSTAEADGRSGRVVVAPSQESGIFFASGLAPAPEGQTYQGWLINSETDIRSAGLFLPRPDGTAILVLTGDLPAAQAFAITLEPEGGSAQPTALPPLLTVPL
jgi:anti-sigma factor RsiW